MVMSPEAARDLVVRLYPEWKQNRTEVDRLDRWYRGEHDTPTMPKRRSKEFEELQARSVTPWLRLVVTSVAQSLFVDGFRRPGDSDPDPNQPPTGTALSWQAWQANRMDARQITFHRAALAHGLSFARILPGEPFPVIEGYSARKMAAWYANPANDEWPMWTLHGETLTSVDTGRKVVRMELTDAEAMYMFDVEDDGGKITYLDDTVHGTGVCPVVRWVNELDMDGRASGEVEPFIPMVKRIDQDTFDRLVVQRFGAWVVRYIAGLAEPDTDDEKRATKLRLSIEDLLVSEDPDTKFGTLSGTPLDGFIAAREADIRDLAAVTQTPPHHLLGQMANLSAEALAAAESSLTRKVGERQTSFGESHEQMLRHVSFLMGDMDGAVAWDAEVRWRDTESRSLAQAADALGKLAQMLNVPVALLWEKIPGFTQQDVERARAMAADGDVFARMFSEIESALDVGADPGV